VKYRGSLTSRALPAAVATLLAALAVLGSTPAQAGARQAHAADGSGGWQHYLEQPKSGEVKPTAAAVLSGSVSNARGLTSAGHGDTTLTVTASRSPPPAPRHSGPWSSKPPHP